jgi:beta-lactamase class D
MLQILALLVLSIVSSAFAEDAGLAALFREHDVTGTLVISALHGGTTYVHNDVRASTPLLPASSFKIANSLIALDDGVIGETDVLSWPGVDQGVAACNAPHNIQGAFSNSCVWFYQELARRIGTPRYETWLKRLGYGNARPTPVLTTFWLTGDLRISAREQIDFLKRLHRRELPLKPSTFETMRRLMIAEQTPAYMLRAKTGWAGFGTTSGPQTGWYVGYVETKGNVWFFALNMDMRGPADGPLRKKLVMAVLKEKGII